MSAAPAGVLPRMAARGLLVQALHLRWQPGFVVGRILEWTAPVAGVSPACAWRAC